MFKMKMVFIVFFTFFGVSTVFSQNWFTGGNIFFQQINERDNYWNRIDRGDMKHTTLRLSPIFGFIKNNKFDIGINPIFEYETFSWQDNYNNLAFGIGIFSRYSFYEIGKISILGRLGIDYLHSRFNYDSQGNPNYDSQGNPLEKKQRMFRINISPVFQFNLLDNFSLFTSIGSIYFSHSWSDYNNLNIISPSITDYGISFGNVVIGFHILVGSSRNKVNTSISSSENNTQG